MDEARRIEAQMVERGAASDPRTLSLFLATRGEQTATALNLAEQEMKVRMDVFTLDALAWALAAAGKVEAASSTIERALQEGTKDARLFFHAGTIAARAGQRKQSRRWLKQAAEIQQMLLPSEREQLAEQLRML
jgi:Flp pilus assembly protein TadD